VRNWNALAIRVADGRKRGFVLGLVCILLSGSLVGMAVDSQPAMAASFANTYPANAQNAVNCSAQFGAYSWCVGSPNAKGVWPKKADLSSRGYGYRNCTDYVAWEIQQVYGITLPSSLGNANTWGPRLKAKGYTYDSAPEVGDIAAWNTGGGGFGHVAYVYAVAGSVASLAEYNYAGTGAFTSSRTISNGSSGAPSEWVHIGTPSTSGDGTPTVSRLVSTSDGHIQAFSVVNGQMEETWYSPGNGSYGGWSSGGAPNGYQVTGSAAVVPRAGQSVIDVFVRSTSSNQAIAETWYNWGTGQWGGWISLQPPPGTITGDPQAVATSDGHDQVFADVNGSLEETWFSPGNGSFGGWTPV
jgi:surface antigen